QRWNGIRSPTESRASLGPIEASGGGRTAIRQALTGICTQQYSAGVKIPRPDNDHTLPTLRQSEGHSVNNPVCPAVSIVLERGCDDAHSVTTPKVQHEGNVLKHEPFRLSFR